MTIKKAATTGLPKWQDIPLGGVLVDAGNGVLYKTGSWRVKRPVIDLSKCSNCMTCWLNCPDMSIVVKDGKVAGVDADHCKGCCICAQECPKGCIAVVEGGTYQPGEAVASK